MAQFDIFTYPGRNTSVLFVVQIQSTRLQHTVRRVVMALVARTGRVPADSALHPYFEILGQHVYADPFDLASIATVRLGTAVARLAEADCYRVARSIDEMISQA